MAEDKEDAIDLNRLSQRELLILLAKDVRELKTDVEKLQEAQQKMGLTVNELETKSKIWGSIAGFFTAVAALILEKILRP